MTCLFIDKLDSNDAFESDRRQCR